MSSTATAVKPVPVDFTAMQEIQWSPPSKGHDIEKRMPSKNALMALQSAAQAALAFDQEFSIRNVDRESTIPLFSGTEVVICGEGRTYGYFTEYELLSIRVVMDLVQGSFGSPEEVARQRIADRANGQYAVKYLQKGLIETDHGVNAATDMILETKLLMNLAPHPHMVQIYGVNGAGIDSFLESGRKSFFFITDRINETLVDRLDSWRDNKSYFDISASESAHLQQRLEVALDIASALVYLHDRKLVFNVRPDKIGFDIRCSRVKLFNFSQARQEGSEKHAPSITKSDDIHTLAYTAPEVLCNAPVTVSSDVYAFGIMLWEIISLQRPFEAYDRSQHFEKVVQDDERPPIPEQAEWPNELISLLESAWDPHFRPTMKAVHDSIESALLFYDAGESVTTSSTTKVLDMSVSSDDVTNEPERGVRRAKSDCGNFNPASPTKSTQRRARKNPRSMSSSPTKLQMRKELSMRMSRKIPLEPNVPERSLTRSASSSRISPTRISPRGGRRDVLRDSLKYIAEETMYMPGDEKSLDTTDDTLPTAPSSGFDPDSSTAYSPTSRSSDYFNPAHIKGPATPMARSPQRSMTSVSSKSPQSDSSPGSSLSSARRQREGPSRRQNQTVLPQRVVDNDPAWLPFQSDAITEAKAAMPTIQTFQSTSSVTKPAERPMPQRSLSMNFSKCDFSLDNIGSPINPPPVTNPRTSSPPARGLQRSISMGGKAFSLDNVESPVKSRIASHATKTSRLSDGPKIKFIRRVKSESLQQMADAATADFLGIKTPKRRSLKKSPSGRELLRSKSDDGTHPRRRIRGNSDEGSQMRGNRECGASKSDEDSNRERRHEGNRRILQRSNSDDGQFLQPHREGGVRKLVRRLSFKRSASGRDLTKVTAGNRHDNRSLALVDDIDSMDQEISAKLADAMKQEGQLGNTGKLIRVKLKSKR